jgi:PilZ domain
VHMTHLRARTWLSETGDLLSVNMPPSRMKENCVALERSGETMPVPTGRFEKRIARALSVEIRPEDEGMPKEKTLTENVSPHGARVLMEREWRPGQHVLLVSPKEGVRSRAHIVYCERVAQSGFAVGLELSEEVELWAKR